MKQLTSLWLAAAETNRPNIIVILADDLGWKDVGYAGSTFYRTPNIDRLAREDIFQVSVRVETAPPAAFDDSVNTCTAFTGSSIADKEPVLLADGGGANGVSRWCSRAPVLQDW